MVQRALAEVVAEERVEHGTARGRHRHREVARGEALAQAQQIGAEVALLRREQRAGASEAGGDLVADQQHVVGAARGAEPREPVVVGELHARRGLHRRLDDHGRELRRVLGDQPDRLVEAVRVVERGRAHDGEAQRVEHVGAEAVVADRERADRVAVVGAAEREERRAAGDAAVVPVLERDLERLLDRRRAVARVEEVRIVDGHDAGQRLRQLDHDPVAVAEHRRVRAERELAHDRVVELGHVVAERRDPQRRDRVEVALPVDVDELAALGPVDDDRAVVGERRHLGEAVPHHLRVALHPLVVRGHRLDSDAQWRDGTHAAPAGGEPGDAGERPAQPARPAARRDLPLRRAVRAGQDHDRGRREGVGRLPGDDLPPVRRAAATSCCSRRWRGSWRTTSTGWPTTCGTPRPWTSCSGRGLAFAHRSVAEHTVLRKIMETEPERLLPLLTTESTKSLPFIADFLLPYLRREAEAGPAAARRRHRPGRRVPRPVDPVADRRARTLGPRRPRPGRRPRRRRAPRRHHRPLTPNPPNSWPRNRRCSARIRRMPDPSAEPGAGGARDREQQCDAGHVDDETYSGPVSQVMELLDGRPQPAGGAGARRGAAPASGASV